MGKGEDTWTVVAIALVLLVSALDVLVASTGFSGLVVLGPVVASFRLRPRRTAAVAVVAVAAGISVAAAGDRLGGVNETIRIVGIGVVGGVCVIGSRWRERQQLAFERVTRVAEVAQLAILRPIPNRVGPVALASRYLSAAEQALIGGDLYDAVAVADGARVVVGDVRGKGLDAVQMAATALTAFREAALSEPALPQVARAVDRAVTAASSPEDFVTAVFADLGRQGRLELVNCGHHPPLRICSDGVEFLKEGSGHPPLGLGPPFATCVHEVERGDRLLLYTDGLVEARGATGDFYPLEARAPRLLARRSLDAAVDALVNDVLRHVGGRLDDDLAVLLVEIRG